MTQFDGSFSSSNRQFLKFTRVAFENILRIANMLWFKPLRSAVPTRLTQLNIDLDRGTNRQTKLQYNCMCYAHVEHVQCNDVTYQKLRNANIAPLSRKRVKPKNRWKFYYFHIFNSKMRCCLQATVRARLMPRDARVNVITIHTYIRSICVYVLSQSNSIVFAANGFHIHRNCIDHRVDMCLFVRNQR